MDLFDFAPSFCFLISFMYDMNPCRPIEKTERRPVMTSARAFLSLLFAATFAAQASGYSTEEDGSRPNTQTESALSVFYPWFVGVVVPPDALVSARMSSPLLGLSVIVCASTDGIQGLSAALLGKLAATTAFEKAGVKQIIRMIFEEGVCGYVPHNMTQYDKSRSWYVGDLSIGEYAAKTKIFPVRAEGAEMLDSKKARHGYVFQMWLVSWPGK